VKVKILEIDSERRRLSLSIKRVEDQILPRRTLPPAGDGEDAGAGDLDNVPELGLSEDVFAAEPAGSVDQEPAIIEDAVVLDDAAEAPAESPDEDEEQA